MMALAKHGEEIAERRSANGTAIVYEYQYPHPNGWHEIAVEPSASDSYLIPPDEVAKIREFLLQAN